MIKKFFWMCSGADQDILEQCSKSEQIKQAGIGGSVFFTAIMAFIASGYALYTVFDNVYTSIFFGFIWGLLIFNLDRFIVSSIRKKENPKSEFIQAIPRLILALIIAIVISKPLELKIFEKEIDSVLLEEKNNLSLANQDQIALQYNPSIEKTKNEITALNQEVITKEKEVNALYSTYISEAEGTAGTKKLGKGPVYAEKREKHDASLNELQALKLANAGKIKAKEATILKLTETYNDKVSSSQPIIDNFDGLMARINALSKLPWLPSFFIFLLFLAIETAPILTKLMSPRGEYDIKQDDREHTAKEWVNQKKQQRNNLSKTDTILNNKVYTDIAEEEELYNYKKKKAQELLKLQEDAFYAHQKKSL